MVVAIDRVLERGRVGFRGEEHEDVAAAVGADHHRRLRELVDVRSGPGGFAVDAACGALDARAVGGPDIFNTE